MTRYVLLAFLLLARTALAGPSTTFSWSEAPPLDGGATGSVGAATPQCISWVPVVGIANATSLTAWISAGGTSGARCDFGIYDATGTNLIAHTKDLPCDITGTFFGAAGLDPFSLAAGVKYQRCWCSNGHPGIVPLGFNVNFGADFGRTVRNTLSVPLRFNAGQACKPSGQLPDTLGTFGAADAQDTFVLIGTSSP